jgi:hypothetical protein
MPDRRSAGGLALALALAALAACTGEAKHERQGTPAVAAAAPAAAAQPSPCVGLGVPSIVQQPVLTASFTSAGNQIGADCMAWQSFIALNWRANPAAPGQPDTTVAWTAFGDPADSAAKVWESYWEPAVVFSRPAATKLLWSSPRPAGHRLVRISKLDATDLRLIGFAQAGDNKWLTAQNGDITYYEVRINQDEFEFITTNVFSGKDLTTFAGQDSCAAAPGQNGAGGFNLPMGGGTAAAPKDYDCNGNPHLYGTNVGAIEVKASWRVLPTDGSLNGRYLTAQAQLVDPYGKVSNATVGLVGMHIIRRVQGAAQFVWATFEQIDNSPDQGSTAMGYTNPTFPANPNQKPRPGGWSYYNPGCTPATDTVYGCQHNQLPDSACAVGQTSGCDPYSAPMQVTRITPVNQNANNVTGYVWSLLSASSVFNYYRLINVQWPQNSTLIAPQATVPLTTGDITPSAFMANTTLETFLQNSSTNNCMSCHQYASIAVPSQQKLALIAGRRLRRVQVQSSSTTPASSYSFIFVTETRH